MSDPARINGPKHNRLITEAMVADRMVAHRLRDVIAEVRRLHVQNKTPLGALDLKIHDLSLAIQDLQELHRDMDQLLRNAKPTTSKKLAKRVAELEQTLAALMENEEE